MQPAAGHVASSPPTSSRSAAASGSVAATTTAAAAAGSAISSTMAPRSLVDLPVSFLYITRTLQDAPYEPLTAGRFLHALTVQHKVKPASFVAQRYRNELYSKLDGQYGVDLRLNPLAETAFVPSGSRKRQRSPPTVGSGDGGGSVSFVAAGSGGPTTASSGSINEDAAGSMGDDALSRLRAEQLQRISTATKHRDSVCSYFLTKEGCRRGAECSFSHHVPAGTRLPPGMKPYPHGPIGAPETYAV